MEFTATKRLIPFLFSVIVGIVKPLRSRFLHGQPVIVMIAAPCDRAHNYKVTVITLGTLILGYNKYQQHITVLMAKASNPLLQPNPFITYRDPQTGLWIVVKTNSVSDDLMAIISEEHNCAKSKSEQVSPCVS